jgi:hypothetical protein
MCLSGNEICFFLRNNSIEKVKESKKRLVKIYKSMWDWVSGRTGLADELNLTYLLFLFNSYNINSKKMKRNRTKIKKKVRRERESGGSHNNCYY